MSHAFFTAVKSSTVIFYCSGVHLFSNVFCFSAYFSGPDTNLFHIFTNPLVQSSWFSRCYSAHFWCCSVHSRTPSVFCDTSLQTFFTIGIYCVESILTFDLTFVWWMVYIWQK